jgi:AcrR family transcriptional regulator
VAATAERILDAAAGLFWEQPSGQIPLDEVAWRAGVTVQTVIRRFGDKDGLFAAAWEREAERVREQRDQAPPGDVAAAVRVLAEHYEMFGDRVLRLLAEEDRVPRLREITAGPGWVQFDFGQSGVLELVQRSDEPQYDDARYQVGYAVADIESARGTLVSRGVRPVTGIEGDSQAGGRWCYFRDAEGNVFELKERRATPA